MDFSLLGMWKAMGIPAKLVVITLAIESVYSLSVMPYADLMDQASPQVPLPSLWLQALR